MTDMELEIPTVSTGSDTVPVQQASMEVSSSNAHEAAIPIQSTIAPPIVSIDASTTEGTPSGSPPPIATTSSSSYQIDGHSVRVFGAAPIAQTSTTPKDDQGSPSSSVQTAEVPDSFFEASVNDVQSYHSSVVARSKRLNEAPLLTSKHREEEKLKAEKKKSEKWPTTTIRIKFSNGTQIESQFPSTSPIQPVYSFVRSALDPSIANKPFVLYQPPRSTYPEHPVPQTKKPNPHKTNIIAPANYGMVKGSTSAQLQGGTGGKESLNTLGLVPQSVLHVRWEDESMNASTFPAPLLPELIERMAPLPLPVVRAEESEAKPATKKPPTGTAGEKKMPKWLQKGLGKR